MNQFKANIKLLIVSGPSGVGKGSLIQKLLQEYKQFQYSVSLTTRNPRSGEIDGVHYNFVTKDKFNEEVQKNAFYEYCDVHGNKYGTHREYVDNIIRNQKIPLIEIDVQGAEKINNQIPNQCNNLFILPPSIESLRDRLTKRGTETIEVINKRVSNAEKEIKKAKQLSFYHFLVNDQFDVCYEELKGYVQSAYK